MAVANDLDKAALRRVARASASAIGNNVFDLYGSLLCTAMPLLIERDVPFEIYRDVFEAAVDMVYDDLARRETGVPIRGGANALHEPFIDRIGDAQTAYHVCRIVLFAVSGVVEPGQELVTRSLLPHLEATWKVYEEALR